MNGFLNKEDIILTASVNTDEDDSTIYGKLSKIVEKSGSGVVNPYNGLTTGTIEITVDNKNSTIKGDATVYTESQEHEYGDFIVGYTNFCTVK